MPRWTKAPLPTAELMGLGLTPEEGFVLSRLDVSLDADEVVALTGLAKDRATEILGLLATKGAIVAEGGAGSVPPPAADTTPTPLADEPPPLSDAPPPLEDEAQQEAPAEVDEEAAKDEADFVAHEINYRKLYEAELRGLPRDERIGLAQGAQGPTLLAFAFDPDPGVLRAVLENPRTGLMHARIAARAHPTAVGLEMIVQRVSLAQDHQVQRSLVRNPHISEALAKRVLSPKRMGDVYKVCVDVDVPERTRVFARAVLRSKFGTADGEERAGLIFVTEGRVLAVLTGLTIDGRATSLLCSRSYQSVLFVQNLARFAACPPPILAHLLKQPIVRRQPHLKNLLLKHPNMPSDAKRRA